MYFYNEFHARLKDDSLRPKIVFRPEVIHASRYFLATKFPKNIVRHFGNKSREKISPWSRANENLYTWRNLIHRPHTCP